MNKFLNFKNYKIFDSFKNSKFLTVIKIRKNFEIIKNHRFFKLKIPNEKMKKSKRGISPVIATVLLIVIVVVLALIIFLWAKGFIKENVQKKGVSADQVCNELNMEVSYNSASGELDVINKGNTPVYRLELKKLSGGSVDKQSVTEGFSVGESKTIEGIGENYDKVEVFPVILGEVKTSKKAYVCKNSFSTA